MTKKANINYIKYLLHLKKRHIFYRHYLSTLYFQILTKKKQQMKKKNYYKNELKQKYRNIINVNERRKQMYV